jgi:hypothetical protein
MRSLPITSLALRSSAVALLSTTAMIATSGLVSAQTVNEAGARALEAQVPEVLNYMFSSNPDVRYSFNGDIVAEPDGDSYRVSIPGLTLNIRNEADAQFPAFTADVTPQENGWQRAEWDFPGSITVTNPRNAGDRADVTFTSTDNMMTFAPEYGMALISDVSIDDVAVRVQGHEGTITLDSLAMTVDSELSGDGPDSYDSRTDLSADSFLIDIPEEQVHIEIANISMNGETESQRLDLFAILQEHMQGIDPESSAFAEGFLEVFSEHGDDNWMAAADYSMEINDLTFAVEDVSGTLGSASVSVFADDLDQPNVQLGVIVAVDETGSPDLPGEFADVVPSTVNIDITAADAPLRAILDEVRVAVGETTEPEFGLKGRRAGTGGVAGGLEDLDPFTLLGLLLESDALLEINDLLVEAPIGYVAAEGTVDPEPSAAFQAVADVSLDIAGLPEMISFAQRMGGDAAQMAGLASAIAAMGRDGTDDEGTAIKEFDFQLTADGQMLLNGNDLSAMLGMFQ